MRSPGDDRYFLHILSIVQKYVLYAFEILYGVSRYAYFSLYILKHTVSVRKERINSIYTAFLFYFQLFIYLDMILQTR